MNKNLVGIAVLLDEYLFNKARELEINISKKFLVRKGLSQSPHITVKRPFLVDDEKLQELFDYIQELKEDIKPFDITINNYGFFEPTVAYLNVIKSEQLLQLHNTINQDLLKRFSIEIGPREGDDIIFHSTLALSDFDQNTFTEIKNYLLSIPINHTFQIGEIALFYKVDDYWIIANKSSI